MAFLFTIYLFVVVALPLTLGIAVSYRALPRERRCPQCGSETVPVTSRIARMAMRALGPELQRRWCCRCDWEGFARVTRLIPAMALTPSRPARNPSSGCRTEPLRRISVSGDSWRVLLQYWREGASYHGRLLFVGPSGRLWADEVQPFSGGSRLDIVHQAQALSDGLLTYRLRELASD